MYQSQRINLYRSTLNVVALSVKNNITNITVNKKKYFLLKKNWITMARGMYLLKWYLEFFDFSLEFYRKSDIILDEKIHTRST